MNEIDRNQDFDALVLEIQKLEAELSDLVYERDKLIYHTCPLLKTDYMLKIGKLEHAIFEYQVGILRTKRKIELIQACINNEKPYDIAKIDEQLDKEYKEYTVKLQETKKEIDEARMKKSSIGKLLSEEETAELKKLYTLIVKKLHPDINPNTTEEQHMQFNDAVEAYKNGSLSELRIIYLLLDKAFVYESVDTIEKLKEREELFNNQKNYLLNVIKEIKDSFPYNNKELLENEEQLHEKIAQLSSQLTELQEQNKDIENRLEAMLK